MLYTLLLSLTVALWGCGGDGKDEPTPAITITVSQESISVPVNGGVYTVNVTTTGKEWGAYDNKNYIAIDTKNTTSQSGSVTITVDANPLTETRAGEVTIQSGAARKTITITQEAAEESPYYAPEGYTLV